MSSTQSIVALAVLVIVVFAVTFAMIYIPSEGGPDDVDGPTTTSGKLLNLEFMTPGAPAVENAGLTQEHEVPGWQLFWFNNLNDKPVIFGLNQKNCRCSSVVSSFFSGEAKKKMLGLSALAGLGGYVADPDLAATMMDQGTMPGVETTEMTARDTITVPPRTLGWVRMRWTGERSGPQQLTASIWVSQRANVVNLETRIFFYEPIRITRTDRDKEIAYPLALKDLPFRDSIVCWSSTREEFDIVAEVVGSRGQEDTFQLEKPIPLSESERIKLEREHGPEDAGPVLSGYRIPIVLHETAPDGKTQMDYGPLLKWIEIRPLGDVLPTQRVSYRAEILGSVRIGGRNDLSQIQLSTFGRSKGSPTREITIWTDDPTVNLTIDEKATAPYLRARFRKEPELEKKGRRSWQLEVTVPPKEASGKFPRADHPRYRDSAIYLNVSGAANRRVRIPVRGIANLD